MASRKVLERHILASDFIKSCPKPIYSLDCGYLINPTNKDITFCTTGIPVVRDENNCLVPVMAGAEDTATEFIITSGMVTICAGEKLRPQQFATLAKPCCDVVCKGGIPTKDPCGGDYSVDAIVAKLESIGIVVRDASANLSTIQTT